MDHRVMLLNGSTDKHADLHVIAHKALPMAATRNSFIYYLLVHEISTRILMNEQIDK